MKRILPILLTILPGIAFSQSMGASNPQALVTAMQNEGYRAVLETDKTGDPKIKSSTAGSNFFIYFYGCSDNANCQDLQFAIAFNKTDALSASFINEWNRTKFVGKAHIDDEGDPYLEMFVPGAAEVSTTSLKRILARWDTALGQFKEHIDWN